MSYDALIFDLDGTLAHTADDIVEAVRRAIAAQQLPVPERAAVIAAIGGGVSKLVERLVAQPEKRLAVLASFMVHYDAECLNRTRLYPDVAETLAALEGTPMAVLTNKPLQFTARILEGLGIARRFRVVLGGDSMAVRKPDPAPVRRIIAELGGTRPLLVGDSGVDVEAAANAGIDCCAVTYGYHKPGELDRARHRIDRFADLVTLLGKR